METHFQLWEGNGQWLIVIEKLDLQAVFYISPIPVTVTVVTFFLIYSSVIAFHVRLFHLANVGTRKGILVLKVSVWLLTYPSQLVQGTASSFNSFFSPHCSYVLHGSPS